MSMSYISLFLRKIKGEESLDLDQGGQSHREIEIHGEEVRLLYAHTFASGLATLVNALVLAFIQWNLVSHTVVTGWLTCMVAIILARIALARRYHKKVPEMSSARRWGRWYTWGAAATGIGWGFAGILLVPPASVPHQFFTTFVIAGTAAGAMTVLSPVYITYATYLLPTVLPVMVVFLTYSDALHVAAAGIMTLFVLFLLKAGRTQNSFVHKSLQLTMERSELIEHLTVEKERVDNLNDSLQQEIAERLQAEQELKYRLELEFLLTSISTGFINLPPDEIDQGIRNALEQLGRFSGVDRSYVFLFEKDLTMVGKTHEWCADGIATAHDQFRGLEARMYARFLDSLKRKEAIHIQRVADLPAEATPERQLLESQSVQSVVLVPLISRGVLIGFLGFSSIRAEKTWDEETITLLKVVGEMFVNALERKRTQEELEKTRKAAEAAAWAKAQFLANMSHEIRTPMHGVLGMLTLLRNANLDEGQLNYANAAYGSAEMLLGIIDDILDFSKIEAGKLKLERTSFELRKTVEEAVGVLAEKGLSKGIVLECSISDDVPEVVCGDPMRLRQVLVNLLANAVKFTEAGQVMVRVGTEPAEEGEVRLRFEVRDTGIGIPHATQEHLFDPFTQADETTTRKYGGTGLGLAICRQLLELMGGTIGVTSIPGKGSTFWFQISFEHPSRFSQAPRLPSKTENGMRTAKSFSGRRALLAEDNPVNQEVGMEMLRTFGISADVAANGREALDMVQVGNYDLVFMDCQMPEMDGFVATRAIRAWERNRGLAPVIIIALTANAMEGDRKICIEEGMDDYLAKPFTLKEMEELLVRWLKPG